MTRQQVQRSELVDAQTSTAFGATAPVEPANPPIFGPEIRITRLLPGFGVSPPDLFTDNRGLARPSRQKAIGRETVQMETALDTA
jgi:hypothetical protein